MNERMTDAMMMKMNGCRRAMRTVSCTMMLAAFMVAFHTAPVYAELIGVQDDTAMTYTITVGEGETVALSAEDAAALNSLAAGYMQPTRLLLPWDFPGKSTGVGCHHHLWQHPLLVPKIYKARQTLAKP